MNKIFLIAVALIPLILGCATIEDAPVAGSAPYSLAVTQEKSSESAAELKQLRAENQALKVRIAELEKTSGIKMPTGAQIQAALKNAKFYDGEVDGQIGLKTKEAIKKFQEANGLNPDGVMGSRTWEKLSEYLK